MAVEVTRKTMVKMVENGRKWIFAGKWQEMDFRGYMAGNGFSHVLRQFPTTCLSISIFVNKVFTIPFVNVISV